MYERLCCDWYGPDEADVLPVIRGSGGDNVDGVVKSRNEVSTKWIEDDASRGATEVGGTS
jgi:hypothetical protein